MNTIDHREMLAICSLAQKGGPSQLIKLSEEERKVVSLMVKALSKGKESITTNLDIRKLKEHLSQPHLLKSSTGGEKILKGIKNIFTRTSSAGLSRDIDKINPLKKSPQEVRQAQIAFHENIINELNQKREALRGRKDGLIQVLKGYKSISESKDKKVEIERVIREIRSILPQKHPDDPVLLEYDKQLRQSLTVLEQLKHDPKNLRHFIDGVNDLYSQCLTDFTHMGDIIRQETGIIRKLRQS